METSVSVKACNGIAVTFTVFSRYCSFTTTQKQANQTAVTCKLLDLPRRFNCNWKDKKCRCSANCGRSLCLCVFRNKRHTPSVPRSFSWAWVLSRNCVIPVVCVWNLVSGRYSKTTVSHEAYLMTIQWTTTRFDLYWPSSTPQKDTLFTKNSPFLTTSITKLSKIPQQNFRCVAENCITTK